MRRSAHGAATSPAAPNGTLAPRSAPIAAGEGALPAGTLRQLPDLRIVRADLPAVRNPAAPMPLSYCHDTLDSPPGESRRGTGKDRAGRRDDDDDDL